MAGGYRQNPLEVMAYDLQAYFDSNARPRSMESIIRQQCDQKILPRLEEAMKGDVQSS